MFRRPFPLLLAVLTAGALGALEPVSAPRAEDKKAAAKIKVLLIDGQNNHDWRSTSPHLKKVLEDSGKFTVAVSSNLKKGEKPGRIDTVPFPPDLSKYDVVLSNYNGEAWPKEFQKSFDEKIKSGKLGLVIVHAANNSFGDWKEYNEMIGMGWRGRGDGERLKLDDKGKEVRVPKGKDDDSGHRYTGKFSIVVRDARHPITKGMPREWMHASDELYDNMRGPIRNVHVLATAYSKGTRAHEPMIWTISYGKGRVFHTPMGHDLTGMRCVGFITTLLRGTEWAATGKVTIPIPKNFPTADKTSSLTEGSSKPKTKDVWTDTKDPSIPVDFKFQGEYVGAVKGGGKLGCQVIALDKGAFQAVVLPGGLPGEGWDTKHKILMDGKLDKHKVTFTPAKGKRKYLAGNPREFSATSTFPPAGQKDYTAVIEGDTMTGKTDDGKEFELKKTERKSPTLGAKPPEGAVVLFDGKDTKEWNGGRLDRKTGWLNTDGKDILTRRKFNNYKAHVEFLLPFKPSGREQGRANSGFYQVDHYEVQVLDSFGLDGKNNECGGIYTKAAPKVNMCLPPLVWQTYDIEFTNAVRDKDGKKVKNARITLKHNGVLIHDNVEVDSPTGGHRGDPEGTPGPIKLQGHDNPLQYRNVWVVERK